MKRRVAEICLRALMGLLLHAGVLAKEPEQLFKFCTSEVDNEDCDAYCKMTYGRASLHNVPWTTGGCDKDRCECVFNEAELGPIAPFKCWADPRTWSLEEQVNMAEARYQADLDKMDAREQFKLFKKAYDKHYVSPYEEKMRFRVFQDNLKVIKELNDRRSVRQDTAVFGVTKFADLSEEEFDRRYGARRPQSSRKLVKVSSKALPKLPSKKGRNSSKQQKPKKSQKPQRSQKSQKSQNLRARNLKVTLGLMQKSASSRSESGSPRSESGSPRSESGSSRSESGSSRSQSRSSSPPRRSRSFESGRSSRKLERGSSWASRGAASDGDGSRPRSRPPAARNTSYRMYNDDNDNNYINNDNQPPPPPPWIIGPDPRGRAKIDWRYPAHLYPTPESQGDCGCCWSFACVSSMEILWARQEGRVDMFSKQDVADCCSWNNGCFGGILSNGLLWLMTYGTSLAEDYPFTGETGRCKDKPAYVKIESYQTLNVGNAWAQDFVMEHALETSPLSAGYPQNPTRLQFYVRGVWTPEERYEVFEPTGHAVVIVGHFRDAWIIRNSWGADWGMEGHFLLKKRTLGIGYDVHKINGPLTQIFHSQPPSGSSSSSSSDNGGDYDYVQEVDDISRGVTQLYY